MVFLSELDKYMDKYKSFYLVQLSRWNWLGFPQHLWAIFCLDEQWASRDIMLQWPGLHVSCLWCLMCGKSPPRVPRLQLTLAVTSRRLDSGNCGEMWRNNPIRHWTLVCEIPVSQINNTFVLLSSFSFNNDEDAEDCIKCGPLDTLLKSSHKVHYNLHQQLDTIITCFMFNFVQFIHDTIHDWSDDRVWAESPAQPRGCKAINPWSRWDEECLMTLMPGPDINLPGPDTWWWSGAALPALQWAEVRWQQNCSIAKTHPESFNWLFSLTPFNQCHQIKVDFIKRFDSIWKFCSYWHKDVFRKMYKIFDSGWQTNWWRCRVKENIHKNKRTGPVMWAMTATNGTFISRTNMDFTNTIHPITNIGHWAAASFLGIPATFLRRKISLGKHHPRLAGGWGIVCIVPAHF